MQDVLKIVYAALADREALAAAMAEAEPLPVADPEAGQTGPPPSSRPSPMDVGVQGGAVQDFPRLVPAFLCGQVVHLPYEYLAFDRAVEDMITEIQRRTGASREQVVQEALRLTLSDKIKVIYDNT
jgi:hypothetical protein